MTTEEVAIETDSRIATEKFFSAEVAYRGVEGYSGHRIADSNSHQTILAQTSLMFSREYIEAVEKGLLPLPDVREVERLGDLPKRRLFSFVKRSGDILLSVVALIILIIPMALIAILIKCDSRGPVLYKQVRLGKGGRPFEIVKFRSMAVNAEASGEQWATEQDDRVTRLGVFLRKSRLDETPQFFNILKNDMSLVGPRPERPYFYEKFEMFIPGFSQRLRAKPGVTGLAQVSGGYNLSPNDKVIYDIEYMKNMSFLLDAKIVFKTASVLLTGHGAR
jgi:lipopolysaccharide/colanic/teichoic acid biosynthesis glycosyltransferase